ncbi:dephospho-CoA kinase [Candidatus Omnitrophota bacterium]
MSRKIIGITGGLATGKTTVADMFAAKGALKIDADEIAHNVLREDNQTRQGVIELFGDGILTERDIDRRKLAGKVFFDKDKLDNLCRLLHPVIIQRIKEEAGRFPESTVVLDAPLLIEARLNDYVDIVVVVTAKHEDQIKRAKDRGISEEEARSIIEKQMPLSEKLKFADYIIDSDTNLDKVKEGVEKIWQKM